jgi:YggT family protein
MNEFFKQFLTILITALQIAIILRVLASWLPFNWTNNALFAAIYNVTEPVIAPIRRIVPTFGMIDLSPAIAIMVLFLIQVVVDRVL